MVMIFHNMTVFFTSFKNIKIFFKGPKCLNNSVYETNKKNQLCVRKGLKVTCIISNELVSLLARLPRLARPICVD